MDWAASFIFIDLTLKKLLADMQKIVIPLEYGYVLVFQDLGWLPNRPKLFQAPLEREKQLDQCFVARTWQKAYLLETSYLFLAKTDHILR